MRCERMHATITVASCIANQEYRESRVHIKRGLPSCWGCSEGIAAREGKFDDKDVEELKLIVLGQSGHLAKGGTMMSQALWRAVSKGSVQDGMKRCSKCKEIKSIEEFSHNKNSKDGLDYWCRDCYKCYKLSRVDVKKTKENAACPHGVWIDLSRYPDLLKEIERIAENEERTVEAQIRWWIRRNFHSFKQGDMA